MVGNRSWSPKEEALLQEKWKVCRSVKEVASFFPDRTPTAISQKKLELKLGKLPNAKRPSGATWPVIVAALISRGPMQYREICSCTRIPARSVLRLLREAHARNEVHVEDWGSNAISGYWPRIWIYGPGEDAPKPEPVSRKESRARRAKKVKNSPELLMARAAQKRARYWDKKRAQSAVVNSIFSGV